MNGFSPEIIHCPHCQTVNPAIESHCQECHRPLVVYIGPAPRIRRISLATVMLLIAEVAVCLATIRAEPFLGILLSLIIVPTTVRTVLMAASRLADERPMRRDEKFEAFVVSFGVTFVLVLATATAFVATCLPIGCLTWQSRSGIIPAMLAGTISGSYILYVVARRIWPWWK